MKLILSLLLLLITHHSSLITPTYATVDPLAVPNNKFGVHIIQATDSESKPAQDMVNSGGDWGYITVLIESGDLKEDKWQTFFNLLRRQHLVPIVRLATHPDGGRWVRPFENQESAWAEFLDKLNWPTKNRYVTIYNEPNHATEWGGTVDARDYAKTLNKTIDALKAKNPDFFILNAGLDASAPQKLPAYQDEAQFLKEMESEVPGIFNKLDGWTSHSYPNPGFVGSPNSNGRGTIRTYLWEQEYLKSLSLNKNLPIFITETGWKHAEGKKLDPSLPSVEEVAQNYQKAFEEAWNNSKIVAVTPFLLSYQEEPFDHFSFKRYTGASQNQKILGTQYPEYYPQYQTLKDLPKTSGKPIQENKAKLVKGEFYSTLVAGQSYQIPLTFENTGQSIWNDGNEVSLVPSGDTDKLGLGKIPIPLIQKVEPKGKYTFVLNIHSPDSGTYHVNFDLFQDSKKVDMETLEYTTTVKSPVVLKIKSSLKWKEKFDGNYILGVMGAIGTTLKTVTLGENGQSKELSASDLLPDYEFDFTLQKPFYKSKTIRQKVRSGLNELDFGELQPDIGSAILNPKQLWKLLPLSN